MEDFELDMRLADINQRLEALYEDLIRIQKTIKRLEIEKLALEIVKAMKTSRSEKS